MWIKGSQAARFAKSMDYRLRFQERNRRGLDARLSEQHDLPSHFSFHAGNPIDMALTFKVEDCSFRGVPILLPAIETDRPEIYGKKC